MNELAGIGMTDAPGGCPRTHRCHFDESVAKRGISKSRGVTASEISRYRSKGQFSDSLLVNGRLAAIPFPELSTPFRGFGSRPCDTVQCAFRRVARHMSRLWCITTTGPFIPLTIADLPVQAVLTLHDFLLIGCSKPWEPGNRRVHGCASSFR
jgi:hypothetical protein